MAKLPTIAPIITSYASQQALNNNFNILRDAFQNVISRDGSTPNQMLADLDMGGQDVLNVDRIEVESIVVNNIDLASVVEDTAAAAAEVEANRIAAAMSAAAALESEIYVQGVEDSLPVWRGAWQTSTLYNVGNLVRFQGSTYITVVEHISDVFATDLGANRLELFAQQGTAGSGTGDMLGANNLSDVNDTTLARQNLGLGTAAVENANDFRINDVPVGAFSWFAGDTPPDGWVVADGSAVTGLYPQLRQLLIDSGSPFGDNGTDPLLPDLVSDNRFIRAAGGALGVGDLQDDQMQRITGWFEQAEGPRYGLATSGAFTYTPTSGVGTSGGTGSNNRTEFDSANSPDARTGDETRPINIAMLPCIKAFGVVSIDGMADLAALLNAIASPAEAEAGVNNEKLMTPLRTRQAAEAAIAPKILDLAEGVADTPIIRAGWHGYNQDVHGVGSGLLYDHTVDGVVSAVTSPDLEPGYDYMWVWEELMKDNATSSSNLGVGFRLNSTGAYTFEMFAVFGALRDGTTTTGLRRNSGCLLIPEPSRVRNGFAFPGHYIINQGESNLPLTDAFGGAFSNTVLLRAQRSTATFIDRTRLIATNDLSKGKVWLLKRRIEGYST